MAGPFHLLLLIMLVMTSTTAGQPAPKKILPEQWETKRGKFFTGDEPPRYDGADIVIESVDSCKLM
jgi:hypothetical protein